MLGILFFAVAVFIITAVDVRAERGRIVVGIRICIIIFVHSGNLLGVHSWDLLGDHSWGLLEFHSWDLLGIHSWGTMPFTAGIFGCLGYCRYAIVVVCSSIIGVRFIWFDEEAWRIVCVIQVRIVHSCGVGLSEGVTAIVVIIIVICDGDSC
jgi:hypothetical protein